MAIYLGVTLIVSNVMVSAWALSGMALSMAKMFGKRPPSSARAVFHELKPFYLPAVVVAYITGCLYAGDVIDGRRIGVFAIQLFSWWGYKGEDDDDRWKRRAKKVADRVKVTGGKLAVVADGA
jgi:hypothetical protein